MPSSTRVVFLCLVNCGHENENYIFQICHENKQSTLNKG